MTSIRGFVLAVSAAVSVAAGDACRSGSAQQRDTARARAGVQAKGVSLGKRAGGISGRASRWRALDAGERRVVDAGPRLLWEPLQHAR